MSRGKRQEEALIVSQAADTGANEGMAWVGALALLILVSIAVGVLASEDRAQSLAPERRGIEMLAPRPAELHHFTAERWFLPHDEFLGFVEIPAGPFLMGSDPARDPAAFENERWSSHGAIQGSVDLPQYYIGRFEVTIAQFHAFVVATGHPVQEGVLDRAPGDHPVTGITWADALAYAHWLEAELKDSEATPAPLARLLDEGWTISLPSEAEWEKAARGTNGKIYPWGDEPRSDRANITSTRTRAVGSFACDECAFGLADMSGNVWEFTRSPYTDHAEDSADGPLDLNAPALWVMRGGSFNDPPNLARAAVRGGVDPSVRNATIGFRLVLTRR